MAEYRKCYVFFGCFLGRIVVKPYLRDILSAISAFHTRSVHISGFCDIPELMTHLHNNYTYWKEMEEKQAKVKEEKETKNEEDKNL